MTCVVAMMVGKQVGSEINSFNANGFGSGQRNRCNSYDVHSIITPPRKIVGFSTSSNDGKREKVRSPKGKLGSPPQTIQLQAMQRFSPSKTSPTQGLIGGGYAYAGAKFSEPPSPTALPKPPSHWTSAAGPSRVGAELQNKSSTTQRCSEISNQLKLLLNVQA